MNLKASLRINQPLIEANHKVWLVAAPMILSGLSLPMLGIVDTALLGHLDDPVYLASVAIGANIIHLVFWSFGFLRMGTTSLIARQFGAEHGQSQTNKSIPQRLESLLIKSLALSLVISIAMILLLPFFLPFILSIMQASPKVYPLAGEYISIRLYAAPAVLISYTITGWLIGLQRAKAALCIALLVNSLNIVFDLWFILGLGLNSYGAAWASVIAEYSGLLLGFYLIKSRSLLPAIRQWHGWLNRKGFKNIFSTNAHLMLRTLLLLFSINFFTAQGSALGDNILAANAILLQLIFLASYVMDGFCYSAEALCGQAIGMKNTRLFKRYVALCGFWVGLSAFVFSSVYFIVGTSIIDLFSNTQDILSLAQDYLPWLAALPLCACLAYLFDGVFIGTGDTKSMQYSMLFSVVAVLLPLWWISTGSGNHGLWFAFLAFHLARSVSLAGIYWKKYR